MKELSIEEKAKRYDNLLVKLQEAKVDNCVCDERYCCVIDDIVPELKESEDEKMRKSIIYALRNGGFYNNDKTDEALAWLEKQGEQKSINDLTQQEAMNIADTKFKIGDWIVYNRNDHSRKIMQIYDIRDNRYYFNDNIHFSWSVKECDEKSHLWTIEDAKDGDVLCIYECDEPKIVFIFKGILKKHCALSYHCYYNIMYPYFSGSEKGCLVSNNEDVKPATKEQHELLLQKMKETGYEWDVEKKELKKIEQTTEIPFDAKDSELQEATYYIPDGYHAEINGNEVVIKKGKQNTTWKPTEKQINAIRLARSFVTDDFGNNPTLSEVLKELEEQLKTL